MMASAAAVGICLQLAAVPDAEVVHIDTQKFTLAWMHSIEHQRWEELYSVRLDNKGQPYLQIDQARVKGSGAGMEPASEAEYKEGWYQYVPAQKAPDVLALTRSEYTPDYEFCTEGQCASLGQYLLSDGGVTNLWACRS
ncbi:DUF1850 domain-containing protein [Paenalcaligenes niemegkensis]|uniref:DUF1850 domain-containing protein n=1 Tax=Paenalcaligenes niemegkensis TaxID=2895469 RepID=UPI001EE7A5E6|nr:DUF1850 domain-containing protein [Paenalcaligenes niemegkensis]MCQ9615358.1 DUF1850 domain-containing protein [Paenalcaligenes niemegkensis]